MKAVLTELLEQLDQRPNVSQELRVIQAMAHGSMSVELYAPIHSDRQSPHQQDEIYIIHTGSGILTVNGVRYEFGPGTCFFVPAGVQHCFEKFTPGFTTWVIFWGPEGGEKCSE